MSNTFAILQKVVVNYFYRVNTGFFLFVFFVLFGLPQNVAQFHRSLVEGIIQNPSFLAVVLLAWLLYNVKCLDYVGKQLRQPEQQFLYCLQNLPAAAVYGYMLFVQVLVYLPALLYSAYICMVAVQTDHISAAVEIILFHAGLTAATALLYTRVLQHKTVQVVPGFSLTANLSKPLFSVPVFHIWHNKKQMLLVSKIFSLFVLYLFFKLYQPDHPDIRPLLLCFMLATVVNCIMVFETRLFEENFLGMLRNFPLTGVQRFSNTALAFTLLMLPELLFVWKGFPQFFSISDYPQLLLMGAGLLLLCYSVLLAGSMKMDNYIRTLFGVLIALFFIILYNPGVLLELAIIIIAFGLYISYYEDYEEEVE